MVIQAIWEILAGTDQVRFSSCTGYNFKWLFDSSQGGRTWQPFVGGKNRHENIRQTRIYNFRNKSVIFARDRKFANLTQ